MTIARQFGKYGGIAAASAAVDYAVFSALYFSGAGVVPAQMLARISGGAFSFFTNKYWNFGADGLGSVVREGRRFLIIYCVSYLLSLSLIYLFFEIWKFPVYPSKIAADSTCFLFNFMAFRGYVFHHRTGITGRLRCLADALRKPG